MKRVLIFLFIVNFFSSSLIIGQERITVSTLKMGPFKLQMKKNEVERILNKKIPITLGEDEYSKSVDVNYKDYIFTLDFASMTESRNPDSLEIFSIATKDVRIKTLSGIGIGNTKQELLNMYSDKYDISLYNAYEWNKITETLDKIPGKRTFTISDNILYTQLQFTLMNNFITEISLLMNEGD